MSALSRELYGRIAAATGETVETVARMEVRERRELMETLGIGQSEEVLEQIAAATGESLGSVISLEDREREQLVKVGGSLSLSFIFKPLV